MARERSGAAVSGGACADGADGADAADAAAVAAGAGACVAAAAAGAGAGACVAGAGVGVAAGACVTGAWAGGDETGGAGAGAGRLLLIRREDRAGASEETGAEEAAGAATVRAGAFLAGALPGAELLDTEVNGFLAGASAPPSSSRAGAGAADFAALVAFAAFFAGAGSSGWTGRRRPSASALRRTRSACASSMEDEWLLTPMPRERASSSPSLLVRPSSLASS